MRATSAIGFSRISWVDSWKMGAGVPRGAEMKVPGLAWFEAPRVFLT